MPPPAAATVQDFDEDDPYAPYTPSPRSSAGPSRPPPQSQAEASTSSSSGTPRTGAGTSTSTSTSTSTGTSGQGSYDSTRNASRREEREHEVEDDDEPLFGGRPFRDAHDPDSKQTPGAESDASKEADKEGLYAILNVDKEATEERIRDAYKALAVVLHPDKHQDPARKAAAESRFRDVQHAYEVLTDREKRAVYDYFGEEGLKSSWTVSLRGRSPAEMQAEFERESRRRQAADAESLVKSKGDFTAHIDATALFIDQRRIPRLKGTDPFRPITAVDRFNRIGCTQLIGKHGFDTQVTNTTSLNLSGQMVSRGGMGGGNLVGTLKTHWSPRLFSEVSMTMLRPQIITTKGQFTLDQNSFFTWQSTLQTFAVPPTLNLTYGQRLSSKSNITGFTAVRTGTYSLGPWGKSLSPQAMFRREPAVVSVGITKQVAEGKGWTMQTSVSQVDQSISVDYSTKVLGGIKVRTGFNLGTGSGLNAFTNGERRLTETVRLGLGVNFGIPGGVSLRVKVNRLGQRVTVPILLSPEFRSDLVILFTALPAFSYTALHHLYLQPRKRKRLTDRLSNLRRENQEMIAQRRAAAVEACEVLREQALKRAEQEFRRDGLVIIEAHYGRRDAFPPPRLGTSTDLYAVWEEERQNSTVPVQDDEADELVWDVRIPLQALVGKGQLIIPGGRTKSNILGFHDPVMGERKHLRVRYLFRGQLHETVIEDVAPFAAPLRSHQL